MALHNSEIGVWRHDNSPYGLVVMSPSSNLPRVMPFWTHAHAFSLYDYNRTDGAICNWRAINHSNLSILEGLATLIGSHLTREPQKASPLLTKWWNWELMLATNFCSLCPKVTNFGSQNFGYQIWFCTRLFTVKWVKSIKFWTHFTSFLVAECGHYGCEVSNPLVHIL